MAILTGHEIKQLVNSRELEIEPFDEEQVEPASYDLRLHSKVLASPLGPDLLGKIHYLTDESPLYSIQPGQMVGVMSSEIMTLPLILTGRFGIRSDFARKGINAFGGLQLDPGWRGRLMLNLLNVGPEPIPIRHGDLLFSVEFHRLAISATPYDGPYKDQTDFTPDQEKYILAARTTSLAEIPALRDEIGRLRVVLEDLADRISDPDLDLHLKPEIEGRLRKSIERSPGELLGHDEIWSHTKN